MTKPIIGLTAGKAYVMGISVNNRKREVLAVPPLSAEAEIVLLRFMETFVDAYCGALPMNNEVMSKSLVDSVRNTVELMHTVLAFSIREEDMRVDKGI